MATLLPLALLSALTSLALLWPQGRSTRFWWLTTGLLLMVTALVITLAIEVPIDQQIQHWTAATLPGDWRSIQTRWERWHTIRTFAAIAALVAVTISATLATPPDQPATNPAPAGSSDRSAGSAWTISPWISMPPPRRRSGGGSRPPSGPVDSPIAAPTRPWPAAPWHSGST
jgi:Domain of unknown function (DUF1772)